VLIAQPSIFLISQTLDECAKLTPQVRLRAIHGENSDRVIADVIDHSKHTSQEGEILLVTHSALMLLPYFHRKQQWHLILDEIPQADWCAEFNIPHTHRLITDCFAVDPEAATLADNRYVRAVPKDRKALEQMACNKDRDQVYDLPAVRQYAALAALVCLRARRPVLQPYLWRWREAQAIGIRPLEAIIGGWLRVGDGDGRLLQGRGTIPVVVGTGREVPATQGYHQVPAIQHA
jgi:hypothetical protein